MIVDAILSALTAVVVGLLDLFPTVSWPNWLVGSGAGTLTGTVAGLAGYVSGFGRWVPFDIFVSTMAGLAAIVAVAVVVRAVRWVISIVTLGGGT